MSTLSVPPQFVYVPERCACEVYAADWSSHMRSIVEANPGERLPRMVAADWLEEHGEEDMAGYLRACCAAEAFDDVPVDLLVTNVQYEVISASQMPYETLDGLPKNVSGYFVEAECSREVFTGIAMWQHQSFVPPTSSINQIDKWMRLKRGSLIRLVRFAAPTAPLEVWVIYRGESRIDVHDRRNSVLKFWASYCGPWEPREEYDAIVAVRDKLQLKLGSAGKLKHLVNWQR